MSSVPEALVDVWPSVLGSFERCGRAVNRALGEQFDITTAGPWLAGHYVASIDFWRDAQVQRFPDAAMRLVCATPAYFGESSALAPPDVTGLCVFRFIVEGPRAVEVASLPFAFAFAPGPTDGPSHGQALRKYAELCSAYVELLTPSLVTILTTARRWPLQ